MRFKDGEYIYLNWDGTPDAYHIMGHVDSDAGLETLREEDVVHDENEDKVGIGVHCYGRWSMEPGENGNQHFLRTYKNTGRGRFKQPSASNNTIMR